MFRLKGQIPKIVIWQQRDEFFLNINLKFCKSMNSNLWNSKVMYRTCGISMMQNDGMVTWFVFVCPVNKKCVNDWVGNGLEKIDSK
jgi:hypothetical protein